MPVTIKLINTSVWYKVGDTAKGGVAPDKRTDIIYIVGKENGYDVHNRSLCFCVLNEKKENEQIILLHRRRLTKT